MQGKLTRLMEDTLRGALDPEVRYVDSSGGTRSGKTFAILDTLIWLSLKVDKTRTLTSVVSETYPHLSRGAIRDFQGIMQAQSLWDDARWNKTASLYTFPSGSVIEFFSADTPAKVHGPARDRLFVNEAQNIPWETARQLFVRTSGKIFIDYNPTCEFWAHTNIRGSGRERTINSTYLDNPYLSAEQVAEIESNRTDANWWDVYGLGKIGRRQGLVFDKWEQVRSVPEGARLVGRGVDFGFTADPTAVVDVYLQGGCLYLHERLYLRGLTNDQIAGRLKAMPPAGVTVADSAELKSITELRNMGIRGIEPAIKGAGSVNIGIDALKRYLLRVTSSSTNLINELRNYMWRTDRLTGRTLNIPMDRYNHAIDAARYVVGNCLLAREKKTPGAKARVSSLSIEEGAYY